MTSNSEYLTYTNERINEIKEFLSKNPVVVIKCNVLSDGTNRIMFMQKTEFNYVFFCMFDKTSNGTWEESYSFNIDQFFALLS